MNIPSFPIKLSRKRIFFAVILLLIIWPMFTSFILAPRLSIYKTKNPRFTNFMKYRMHQAEKRGQPYVASYSYVPLKEMSPMLIKAVLFAEDARFYQHHGIDLATLGSSLIENVKRRKIVWGGSTITMQLCKNLFLTPKKTFFRKSTEILLALRMEKTLSKYRILELYLNLIEWGPGIFGAENASQFYFYKSVRDLDAVEGSFLASIIMSPRLYDPDKENKFFNARQQWIYESLLTGVVQEEPTENILPWELLEPEVWFVTGNEQNVSTENLNNGQFLEEEVLAPTEDIRYELDISLNATEQEPISFEAIPPKNLKTRGF